jgi:hypothetical protein
MPTAGRVIPWLVLGFSLMALALGLYEWGHPPFSNQQIEASLADTWEVAASTSRVLIFVFLGLGVICVALARKAGSGSRHQIVAYIAAVCCLLTVAIFLRNHVVLTKRAAVLTGQDFGALFGLL